MVRVGVVLYFLGLPCPYPPSGLTASWLVARAAAGSTSPAASSGRGTGGSCSMCHLKCLTLQESASGCLWLFKKTRGRVIINRRCGLIFKSPSVLYSSILLYCVILYCIYCIVLCGTILYYNVVYSIILYYIVLQCIILFCLVLYGIALYHIVLYSMLLYYIVLYCNMLYYIVVYCITLYCFVLYGVL